MTTPRPTCCLCGQPYGRRSTTSESHKHRAGEEPPPYRGNGIVVKTRTWGASGTGHIGGLTFMPGDIITHRDIWDGETWIGGYPPFCTLRCALTFARHCHDKMGIRLKPAR